MPTLLAPLPPPSASRMELPTVSFFGRTFEEYMRFFALDPAACLELVRVSAGEVRIHPVCNAAGRTYAELPRLRADLAAQGIRSDIVPVAYEFFAGADSMLVLRRDRSLRRAPAA